MSRSWSSVKRVNMYTSTVLLLCGIVGSTVAYYVHREVPYYTGPNDPYPIVSNYNSPQEQSQRLFWGNGQGSNQVGGTGLWATLTNKFPFLGNMFGRMELPTEYGAPKQFYTPSQYSVEDAYRAQVFQQPGRAAFGRDVAITDDAVIVTPPQVPIVSQPIPAPVPVPQPAPAPQPQPSPGYNYEKPRYRLELPQKYY